MAIRETAARVDVLEKEIFRLLGRVTVLEAIVTGMEVDMDSVRFVTASLRCGFIQDGLPGFNEGKIERVRQDDARRLLARSQEGDMNDAEARALWQYVDCQNVYLKRNGKKHIDPPTDLCEIILRLRKQKATADAIKRLKVEVRRQ